jgi:hypothetical protein
MWQKVAKFKGAEYFCKALYNGRRRNIEGDIKRGFLVLQVTVLPTSPDSLHPTVRLQHFTSNNVKP